MVRCKSLSHRSLSSFEFLYVAPQVADMETLGKEG